MTITIDGWISGFRNSEENRDEDLEVVMIYYAIMGYYCICTYWLSFWALGMLSLWQAVRRDLRQTFRALPIFLNPKA
jgi:hypothetical protein